MQGSMGKGVDSKGEEVKERHLEKEEDLVKTFWKKMERSRVLSGGLIFSHTRRERFSQACLQFLVARAWPADQTASKGSCTWF